MNSRNDARAMRGDLETLADALHRARSLQVAELVVEHDVPALLRELAARREQHGTSTVPTSVYESVCKQLGALEQRHRRLVGKLQKMTELRADFRVLLNEMFGDGGAYVDANGFKSAIVKALDLWKETKAS